MNTHLLDHLRNKKILILGFGVEGKSTYQYIRKHLPDQHLTIADKSEIVIEDTHVTCVSGEKYLEGLEAYDLIIKSPGLPLYHLKTDHLPITSQTDLFLRFTETTTVGITGTKGKTTTTSILYNICRGSQKFGSVYLLGNGGKPIFSFMDEIQDNDLVILEMSSFQCEYLTRSPDFIGITNIASDHLDLYPSQQDYVAAKLNLLKKAQSGSKAILPYSDDRTHILPEYETFGDNESADYRLRGTEVYLGTAMIGLPEHYSSHHHRLNASLAIGLADKLGIESLDTQTGIDTFVQIRGRMEDLGIHGGKHWINDGASTNPFSAIQAIQSQPKIDAVILGGMDRGIDLHELIDFLRGHDALIVCYSQTGKKLSSELGCPYFETLRECVDFIKKSPQDHILFSPGAASFDQFLNMDERSEVFRQYVLDS